MNYGNFNASQWIRVIDNDADQSILAIKSFSTAFKIKYAVVNLYIQGAVNITNEQIQVQIHSSDNLNRVLASSSIVNLSDVVSGNNFLCRVRTDFSGFPIDVNTNYYFSLKTINYTRDADNLYISTLFDAPFTVQKLGSAETATTIRDYPKRILVYGEFYA